MQKLQPAPKQRQPPQVDIYNRHFYVRASEHQLRQAQYEQEIKQLASKPKITVASYQILCQQLEARLARVIASHSQN